jgi:hypothetical protein
MQSRASTTSRGFGRRPRSSCSLCRPCGSDGQREVRFTGKTGLCEHAFVTSQGHAYSRSRRALLTKNLRLIDAAARELGRVGLEDALRILVVLPRSAMTDSSARRPGSLHG